MNPQTKTVARINKVDIVVIENGEKHIAVKPICEALGVSIQGQIEKLKSHPIFGSVVKIIFTTGTDGKQYGMYTIPYKWVFGWLTTIDPRKVKPEAAESVLKYQTECYEVLYSHFTNLQDFLAEKTKRIEYQINVAQFARTNYNTAKNELIAANADLNIACNYIYEVLYSHFTNLQDFLAEKTKRIEYQINVAQVARTNYNTAKNKLIAANADLNIACNYSSEDFITEKRHLQIQFTSAKIVEPITEED